MDYSGSSIKWLIAGSGGVALLFVLATVISVLGLTRLYESEQQVRHSDEVMLSLERVLTLMIDAETGQRGYLLTGDERYLEPYTAARISIDDEMRHAGLLTLGNIPQQERIAELRTHVSAKLAELESTIRLRREQGLEAALQIVLTDAGKRDMDAARGVVNDMRRDEQRLLSARETIGDNARDAGVVASVGAGLLGIAICAGLAYALRRHFRAQTKATAEIYDQKELFRTTLASIGDGVITTDVAGRVSFLNQIAESLTGWTQHEAAGQPLESVFNIVNEESRRTVENPALRALREGIIVGLANHTVLIARDGKELPIDDSGAPIRNATGTAFGAVLVFRDVTERRLAERNLTAKALRHDAVPQQVQSKPPPVALERNQEWAPSAAQENEGGQAVLRILIADDNRDSVESLGMLLRTSGYQVYLAHDGTEAVDVATAMQPDVVILDIGMPKLNGYDAAQRIREQSWATGALLIALTGWSQDQDRQRSMAAGFDYHMTKPVEADGLEKLLQEFKSRRGAQTSGST